AELRSYLGSLEPPLQTDQLERLNAALSGRYAVERELGSGGMATVYLADDLKHRRKVAVKVLRPELASIIGPDRFLREIEIAAKLNHPHILALYDSGRAGEFLFYVMPYVKGQSLRHRLHREKPLPIEEAIAVTRDAALALDLPYTGPTAQAVIAKRLAGPAPGVRRLRATVPGGVEQALLRALATVPADRFASAAAFAEALTQPRAVRPRPKSIAVLPFTNLSPDPANEYFADGITEDIIAQLSKIRALTVISSTSVMPLKQRQQSLRE